MATFTPPTGAVAQPEETAGCDEAGNRTKSFSWKGPYTALETAGKGISKGDVVATGWIAAKWNVRRTPGDYGVLTIECTPPNPTGEGGQGQSTVEPLKDKWSIRSVRNDVSILAYCGPSEVANPNRAMLEAWMKEPDGDLAKDWKFRKTDGSIVELTDASIALAQKIAKGIESVIRFYPVVTRTRTYAECPPACLENVGFIDTPPAPTGTAIKPNGLSTAVAAHQWLKVQDDADERDDGKYDRIESWWGIAKSDDGNSSPWDANLYGASRWPMPYQNL